jgi:RNA polymerase sigma-70 factor (ECF subfamily)
MIAGLTMTHDTPEFVELLIRHQNDLLRYVAPLVGNLADAQDVLQETAKALWKKFDDYDVSRPFLPWARTFARNEVLLHHRRRRRYTFLTEELVEQLAEGPADVDEIAERRRHALAGCMQKLSADDRLLLDRRYGHPETLDRLASDIGRTANVLYKSLGRIRRVLHECIERTLAAEAG